MRELYSLLRVIFVLLFSGCNFATAHPHVFITARLKINIDSDGKLESTVQDWDFDPVFSAGVLVDFAKTNKHQLTEKEKKKLTHTIFTSMADYDYFQVLKRDGQSLEMVAPNIFTLKLNKILSVHLENKPKQPLKLEPKHHYVFYVADPTFYVDVSFKVDSDVVVSGLPSYCQYKVYRPDPDKVLTQDLSSLSEDFFADPKNGSYLSSQLATRIEFSC